MEHHYPKRLDDVKIIAEYVEDAPAQFCGWGDLAAAEVSRQTAALCGGWAIEWRERLQFWRGNVRMFADAGPSLAAEESSAGYQTAFDAAVERAKDAWHFAEMAERTHLAEHCAYVKEMVTP